MSGYAFPRVVLSTARLLLRPAQTAPSPDEPQRSRTGHVISSTGWAISTHRWPQAHRRYWTVPSDVAWVDSITAVAADRPQLLQCSMPPACCNDLMQFNHYGGTGTFLAAALLNTADFSPAALELLLAEHEMTSRRLTAGQGRALAAWVEQIRPVFGETDVQRQLGLVNQLLTDATTSVRVSMHDGMGPHLHYITGVEDPVARIRAALAGGLAVALCGAGGHRLGRCAGPGCPTVYVDTSRNGRRRFCSLACANRVNVAAHRARAAR